LLRRGGFKGVRMVLKASAIGYTIATWPDARVSRYLRRRYNISPDKPSAREP